MSRRALSSVQEIGGKLEEQAERDDIASFRSRRQPRAVPSERAKHSKASLHPAVKLFMIGLIIPWVVPLAGVNLPVYRIVLIMTLMPSMASWLTGKAGPVRAADVGVLLYCLWIAIALTITAGIPAALQPSASYFIDGMGAYLLARCYIRNAEDFSNMVAFAVKLIALMLPFALYEWMTGHAILLELFGKVFPTVELAPMPPRMGVYRVQGPFSHSILFGVFCGSLVALAASVDVSRRLIFGRWLSVSLVVATTFLSMSSAPIAGIALQAALLIWSRALGRFWWQWKLLWAIALVSYLVVEFGSNQTPVQFYISHFTFDRQTGWYRLLIWDFGSASVMNHPLFGIGKADWVRPPWMVSGSVDNFWLMTAMSYGLPSLIIIFISIMSICVALARKRDVAPALQPYLRAYLICMASFVFVGSTVHFWSAVYCWFFFLVGCGVWLLDAGRADKTSGRFLRTRAPHGGRRPT
ncbi:O-antigen ligase family protein [Rhizobium sp. 16-488-2a]|nr:O-antigen ligase family protein [Rhizobium sp. 16-488-2b]MBO9177959.1 O-antigen ligase family protein [Rhizobium sp. 16-488-2a]